MQDRIMKHDRDIRLARSQISAGSGYAHNTGHHLLWNEVKFIDRDPHWYTRRVKDAIHTRLHPNNINWDSNRNSRSMDAYDQQTDRRGNNSMQRGERNTPITAVENHPITAEHRAL